MPKLIILTYLVVFSAFTLLGQGKTYSFKLNIFNYSSYTSYCSIPGNEKADSISPGKTKQVVFKLDINQPAFYLLLTTTDTSRKAYHTKMFRILNNGKVRTVNISPNNTLDFKLAEAEFIVNNYNPGLRTKNFWKLDSVIQRHHNSIAAADIIYLSLCDSDVPVDTIRFYQRQLSPFVLSSSFGQRVTRYLEARGRLMKGKVLPAFSLPDSNNVLISLKGIKSKYTLIDFWFSRCGPCIHSFPELQQLYTATNRQQLMIIGISIDSKRDNILWKTSIDKYGLSWINVNDSNSNFTNSQLAIVNFPTRILIDENYKIVLVDTNNENEHFFEEVKKIATSN